MNVRPPLDELKKRRQALFEAMPANSALLLLAAPIQLRNSDTEHKYRQDSNFWYLSGLDDAHAAILMVKRGDKTNKFVIFSRPSDPERELWVGKHLNPQEALEHTGADEASPISELQEVLGKELKGLEYLYFDLTRQDEKPISARQVSQVALDKRIPFIAHPNELLASLRQIKSTYEAEQLRKAAQINIQAHLLAISKVSMLEYEYQLAGILEGNYIGAGAQWSYPPIVAAGLNATVLHYTRNYAQLSSSKLVLVDAGCEFNYYASDITRTYPSRGVFSGAERTVYELVFSALEDCLEAIKKTDATITSIHEAACTTLSAGLIDLRLLQGSLDEVLNEGLYRKFYPHKTGHWLGLDVHDLGVYFDRQTASPLKLKPGMCFTVEPGLYFGIHDESIPSEFRGIGVRIEDDILMGETSPENLTQGCPKTIAELEGLIGAVR